MAQQYIINLLPQKWTLYSIYLITKEKILLLLIVIEVPSWLQKIDIFKEAVSRDFLAFFSFIEPIWVPDKQCEMVSLKN